MDSKKYRCPHCGRIVETVHELNGHWLLCPRCHHEMKKLEKLQPKFVDREGNLWG